MKPLYHGPRRRQGRHSDALSRSAFNLRQRIAKSPERPQARLACSESDLRPNGLEGPYGGDQLAVIGEALSRMDDGAYGTCADCSQPIPPARLEALPYAVTCIGCAEKREAAATTG